MDIETIKNQLYGLEQKGKDLRAKEKLFLKAQGLDESIEEARAEITELETDIQVSKEDLAELKTKKAKAISATAEAMAKTMADVLPKGKAVLKIDETGVLIGWKIDGVVHPYAGLSGGEKVTFDGALCHALKAGMLVYECAEVDKDTLPPLLEKLAGMNVPIIVNTCHAPGEIPEGWNVVTL